jgi:anti-sigma factor (TIGR02949 family)
MSRGEMVPCDHVITQLWEYIDGGVGAEDAANVEAHLDICARCFPEYDFRRAYRNYIREVGPQAMPLEMKRRVFEALLEEERRSAESPTPRDRPGLWSKLRSFFCRG